MFYGAGYDYSGPIVNEDTGVEMAFIWHTPFEDADRSFVEGADWRGNSSIALGTGDVLLVRTDRGAVYKVWIEAEYDEQVLAAWAVIDPI